MNKDYSQNPIFRFLVTDFAGNSTELATDPVLIESGPKRKGMILPFQPLTMTFYNVDYFVDMPKVIFLLLYILIFPILFTKTIFGSVGFFII